MEHIAHVARDVRPELITLRKRFEDERASGKRIAALALRFPQSLYSSPSAAENFRARENEAERCERRQGADRALWPEPDYAGIACFGGETLLGNRRERAAGSCEEFLMWRR
jgi:hypothetical protein